MARTLPQFDLDDDSPEIAYFPFVNLEPSPNVSAGWQLLYTGSGAATGPGQLGLGTSFHHTSLDGASLHIGWNGTGIDLVGSVSNAFYNISLDGVPSAYSADPANAVLASFDSLQNTNHSLLLTTIITNSSSPDAFLSFDKARITYAPPAGLANTTNASQAIIPDSHLAFMGSWSYVADNAGNFLHVSNSAGDRAEATFNGSAITIYGLTSSYSGDFTVTLDDITTNLSALSSYNNSDSLLFYATDLSQNVMHHISVINQQNRTLALRADGVNITTFGDCISTTSSSNYLIPAGTIAAIVLAAVLLLVIVGIIYYACWVRRKARNVTQHTFSGGRTRFNVRSVDVEQVANANPGEELESTSLSTSKGYGFGLGLRRGFPFPYRKGKMASSSSGFSRNGTITFAEAHPMTLQRDRDEKRFSTNTLTENFPVLVHAPESEKLAPGWYNPAARAPPSFKYGRCYKEARGILLPELLMERALDEDDDEYDDDADVKTLTSRQDEALAATLSLSPRTSEAPSTPDRAMLYKAGVDIQHNAKQSHDDQHPEFLQVRNTSPFRVDVSSIFATRRNNHESKRTSESGSSTWSKVRARLYRRAHMDDGRRSRSTDRQETSSSSGPESVPVVMHESGSVDPPSEAAPSSETYSFLDLSSSRVSLGQNSKTTTLSSTPAELGHGNLDTSVRMGRIERPRDDMLTPKPDAPSTASGGSPPSDDSGTHTVPSAQTVHTQRSSPFPIPISIPPSTHTVPPSDDVPERHITPSPPPSKSDQYLQAPQIQPPELSFTSASSPTESVPFSVSDIYFRHSFSDYAGLDSRRASVSSVLPPHPPLPHVDGSQASTPTYASPPPYIVQRVLGLPISPLSPLLPVALAPPRTAASPSQTIATSGARHPEAAVAPPYPPMRVSSLLGPRPRPSTGSVRGSAARPLPMQGGRESLRGQRHHDRRDARD